MLSFEHSCEGQQSSGSGQHNGYRRSIIHGSNALTSAESIRKNDYNGTSRPSRESVLKRLSEALMRRSLTKIDLSQRGLLPSDAKLVKMALLQNKYLSMLKLGYNNLGDVGVATLGPGIAAHKALASLDLGFNNVGDDGIQSLSKALLSSGCSKDDDGTLHTLYLAGNLFGEDGALAIAEVLRRGCSVKRLHMTGNRIGPDGVKAITEAIIEREGGRPTTSDDNNNSGENSSSFGEPGSPMDYSLLPDQPVSSGLQELFLGGTGMGPSGCTAVARMLECSTSIRVISMANCSIGDAQVEVLAASMKRNRDKLPLEALHLSFNEITCKGLDSLMNAIWGSPTLRELRLDNNDIGDRGAQQVAAILPHVKTLSVLDIGFNNIRFSGMRALMKVVASTDHLISLSVSGNPIDTSCAKVVAYAMAYNKSLKCLFLVHCSIDTEGQRHIAAGVVSNRETALRKLSGFALGPVIVTIGFPAAMEHWTNERSLNFLHYMWEQSNQDGGEPSSQEKEIDPLHFLPESSGKKGPTQGPLDPAVVVEVATRAYESLRENGMETLSLQPATTYHEPSFDCPLAEDDAIILEKSSQGSLRKLSSGHISPSFLETSDLVEQSLSAEASLSKPSASFVAAPVAAPPAEPSIPDPDRKQRIVEWLCKNIQHLNELAKQPFDSGELWRLHQHYFTPVVNETGGSVSSSPASSMGAVSRIVSSVPDVSRRSASVVEPSTVTASAQSSDASSDPSLPASPPSASLPMLKRKVSYRFLGDAAISSAIARPEVRTQNVNFASVSKLIEDGAVGHSLPPKTKRARRNKTRISFLPRIKAKLDSYLDTCHEKALILMRQLFYVEQALLGGKINPCLQNAGGATHLFGILADEAQMILLDMM